MKQKILMTFIESGFGHISSMESIYTALRDEYSELYDIDKSYIMCEDGFPALLWWNKFFIKQVENTNKIHGFGQFIFSLISLLGGHKLMRFVHRNLAFRSFRQGLAAIAKRKPNVIVTNHYFTNLLAVEYKRRVDPNVRIINYNPDNTLHSFWDRRDGIFVVNNKTAFDRALKLKFKYENLREVTPCVRGVVEANKLDRAQLREKFDLPQDKFTVVIADGGYMFGKGTEYARKLIKSGLPITLCILAGKNEKRFNEFSAIAEGKGKLKLKDGMTLRVFGFLDNAHELYGAADVFLTKGGPNAVLDSVYMRTPVMINLCPHMIEEMTVKYFIDEHGCGERAFNKGKTVKRIAALMKDPSDLERYRANIEKFLDYGNGASAVAAIIDDEAAKQRAADAERGVYYDCDLGKSKASESVMNILGDLLTDETDAAPAPLVKEEQSEAVVK